MTTQLWPHINRRRGLQLWRTIFESQLMARPWPSLIVKRTLTQNEMIIVEVELRRVIKEHLPDLTIKRMPIGFYFQPELRHGLARVFPKFQKGAFAGEAFGLQQNLVFPIVNYILRQMTGFLMFTYVLMHTPAALRPSKNPASPPPPF